MKALFLSYAIVLVLFGIIYFFAILIKRPILCSNIYMACIVLGISLKNFFDEGKFSISDSIFILLVLLAFLLLLLIVGGLKYHLDIDNDMFNEKLQALNFAPEEYIYNNKIHKYTAPNGTKVFTKQFAHKKFIEVSIVNGFRFGKIIETRAAIMPLIRKDIKKEDLLINSLLFIILGIAIFCIYLVI
jgi:hypothetical protein